MARIYDTAEAIIEAMKKEPYNFDPGTKWSYDNSGYLLIGYSVEKVSGRGYVDFPRENFFQPLSMTNAGVYHAKLGLSHEVMGYRLGTNGFERVNWDPSWFGGAGALYSTVEDLYRWNEGIFKDRVLDPASLQAAFTPAKMSIYEAANSGAGGGFGWLVTRHRGLREITHGGSVPGFGSCLRRAPEEKFTVVILANSRTGRTNAIPQELTQQLVDIFLADKLTPLPSVNTQVSPKAYDALTGRYELEGQIVTISRRGPHLFVQYAGAPEAEIFPQSDTQFFLKGGNAQITFVKDKSGNAVKLIHHDEIGRAPAALRVN